MTPQDPHPLLRLALAMTAMAALGQNLLLQGAALWMRGAQTRARAGEAPEERAREDGRVEAGFDNLPL